MTREKRRKPWQFNVTVSIPHLNTIDMLRACLSCLRWQTERPYIHIIDTGSTPAVKAELESFNADDCEVHYLHAGPQRHPSALIAVAIDLGISLTWTERHYTTHVDVLLKKKNWIETLAKLCNAARPVVGYEMSPRDWVTDLWRGIVGHTTTMMYVPTIRTLGLIWNMPYAFSMLGVQPGVTAGWPDTESGFGMLCRGAFVRIHLVGHETNDPFYEDENLHHIRSYTARRGWPHSPSWDRDAYHQRVAEILADVDRWTKTSP
jgi:hypothetical protein